MANFWGHDENLMYYRNHCYPYMSPGWGSTSDYILLSDGDTWDVAMFTNWSFYSSGGAFTCFDKDAYTVRPGTELTVTSKAYGTTFKDGDFYDFENLDVYLYSDSWERLDMLKDAGAARPPSRSLCQRTKAPTTLWASTPTGRSPRTIPAERTTPRSPRPRPPDRIRNRGAGAPLPDRFR